MSILFVMALAIPAQQSADNSKTIPANAEATSAKIAGRKAIIEFDVTTRAGTAENVARNRQEVEMALKTANLKVIDQWERGFYLVELGSRDFETTLKDLPMRRGALAFEDGNAKTSLKFEEKRRRSARILTPESFASIRWGSTAKDQIRMKDDVEKFSKMKGIHAELINSMLGKKVYGNLNYLKLTPEKGVTLLEVFLKTRAGFYYKQVDVSDESPSKKADPNNKTKTKT